ncbi:HAD family hydrolase [Chitinophaga defluvii]|uniref:HAD family hydrolase n=1 Tax=Chitinophaga defluvii TaxID=3163343 RepID=A0ABV2TD24_9BACT
MTKHISFDLWMTLIRSDPRFKQERALLFRSFFGLTVPEAQVLSVFRETDLLVNRINEIVGKNILPHEMYLINLNKLGADLEHITVTELDAFYALSEELFFKYAPQLLCAETPLLLEQLKDNGYTLNILSNTGYIPGKTLRKLLHRLELEDQLCFQLYSDETGFSKPAPEMFALMISAAGKLHDGQLNAAQILHIGDNKVADIAGANKAGMQSCLVINYENNLKQLFYDTGICLT